SFNLNLTAPECSFNMSYERKWWIIEVRVAVCLLCVISIAPVDNNNGDCTFLSNWQVMPLLIFAVFFLAHSAKFAFKRLFKKRTGRRLWAHVHTMIGTCVAIMYYCTSGCALILDTIA